MSSNADLACAAPSTLPAWTESTAVVHAGSSPAEGHLEGPRASFGSTLRHQVPLAQLVARGCLPGAPVGHRGVGDAGGEESRQPSPEKGKGKSKLCSRHFPSHSELACCSLLPSTCLKNYYSLLFISLPGG